MSISSSHGKINIKSIDAQFVSAKNNKHLHELIVNAPFENKIGAAKLYLGIIVLIIVDEHTDTADRIVMTNNELARGVQEMSVKQIKDIKIPMNYPSNIIVKALQTNRVQATTDWKYLFEPVLNPQDARFNQAGGSIAYSEVHPLKTKQKSALIFNYYQYQEHIGRQQKHFMKSYTNLASKHLCSISKLPAN